MKKKFTKKRVACVAAAAAVTASLLGGTFANYITKNYATNVLGALPENYQAVLVEDFVEDEDWRVGEEVKKEIRVTNIGGTAEYPGDLYGPIFARIQLKEYLDITPVHYEYFKETGKDTPALFMIDREGDFVRFDPGVVGSSMNVTALASIKANSAVWTKVVDNPAALLEKLTISDFVLAKSFADTKQWWYVRTKAGDPNGQYGRPLAEKLVSDVSKTVRVGNTAVPRAKDESGDHFGQTHEYGAADACDYSVHRWDKLGFTPKYEEYVNWGLGQDVITYSEWETVYNKQPVSKWILALGEQGWAYWGEPLEPGDVANGGRSTSNLLESVRRIKEADGYLYYAIHTDMQAVDYVGLANWEGNVDPEQDAPAPILAMLRGAKEKLSSIRISPRPLTLGSDQTTAQRYPFSAVTIGDGKVIWSVTDGANGIRLLGLDADNAGKNCELLVPANYSGKITITARNEDGSLSDMLEINILPVVFELGLKPPYDTMSPPTWEPTAEDGSDRIIFYNNAGVIEFDELFAGGRGWSPYIEIPLSDILTKTAGTTLNVKTNPYGYTNADIYIDGDVIVSKCLLTLAEYNNMSANFDAVTGTWSLKKPVTVELSQPGFEPVDFVIVNMYAGI